MNHTIEDSKGWRITFIGCHKEKESDKSYKLVEQRHNEKDELDENLLDIQEIKAYTHEISIDEKKRTGRQTEGVAISNLDEVIEKYLAIFDEEDKEKAQEENEK